MKINKSFKIIIFFWGFLAMIILISLLKSQRTSYPNVLLISIDALRPDHLGCYGYQRNTSPNIDSLAKKGVYFLNCFATSSYTAHASPALFTGRYLEVSASKDPSEYDNTLDKKFITLAEYLKSFGYYTTAFVSNRYYKIRSGFEQGFDYFYDRWDKERSAKRITTLALNLLNNYRSNKPLFIWMHYIDPHAPYSSPEGCFKIFYNDMLYKEKDKILKLNPVHNIHPNASLGYIPKIVFREDKYSLNYYIARYDAEILYTDFHIGRLLKNIKDDTLIILTADHGESLGEHNVYFSHGENIYDEVLHIPLIIKDNKYFRGGKSISKIVSSIDIVPMVLNRVNPVWYFFNKYKFNGSDLKILIKDKEIKRKYIYSYFPGRWSIRDVNKNIKYILDTYNGEDELYFLPDEYKNLIGDNSLEISSLRQELIKNLEAWLLEGYPIASGMNSKRVNLDEETKRNLKSLGYLQ